MHLLTYDTFLHESLPMAEIAQQRANHESVPTTALYDRRNDQVSLDEIERVLI